MATSQYALSRKETILILPQVFLLDCFVQHSQESTLGHISNMSKLTLIAEVIMRKHAFEPEYYFGATSHKAVDKFESNDYIQSYFSGLDSEALKEALFIEDDKGINNLTPEQSVVAVADKFYQSGNRNPIIISRDDAIKRWKGEHIKGFYRRHTSKRLPLYVFGVDHILQHIKKKYKALYDSAKNSLPASYQRNVP